MFGVQAFVQAGLDGGHLPPRVVLSYTQRTRHAVNFLPACKGQHPVRILLQFGQRVARPDLTNLISQAGIEAVVIKKRYDGGLFGDRAPGLHEFLRTFFRKHVGEFFEIPLI